MASTGLPDGANKHLVAKKLFAEEAGMSTEQCPCYGVVLADGTRTVLRFSHSAVAWIKV